jgi:hypothetical protein
VTTRTRTSTNTGAIAKKSLADAPLRDQIQTCAAHGASGDD